MGLLDRWLKKEKKEGLKRVEKKPAEIKAQEKAESDRFVKMEKHEAKVGGVAYKVLIRPLVTEKAAMMESRNKYMFLVAPTADKMEIRRAVEEVYGVTPAAINIVNVQGRSVRFGRTMGRRSDYKKAIITLPKGKSIAIHEGV